MTHLYHLFAINGVGLIESTTALCGEGQFAQKNGRVASHWGKRQVMAWHGIDDRPGKSSLQISAFAGMTASRILALTG